VPAFVYTYFVFNGMRSTSPVFEPPSPPAGTTIVRATDAPALSWHWKPAELHPARKTVIAFAVLWLGMLALFSVLMAAGVVDAVPQEASPLEGPGLWVIIALQILVGGLLFGVPAFWPRHPERLTLTDTTLEWDSGSATLPLAFLAGGLVHFSSGARADQPPFIWKRRRLTASRDQIANVRLERVGERQRLTLDHGADRIEIGTCLREPEREWLALVIQQWNESND
jgi:hypothetical protein